MADEFSEITNESLGERLGGSIKGVLVGIVLFIAAFPLLFWNEGRAVSDAKRIALGAANTVSIAGDQVQSANDGKLVHVTAKADTKETLADPVFGVKATAIKLRRTVQMFQWDEKKDSTTQKKLGGGTETKTTYRYVKDWSESAIDSANFKHQQDHVNPPMPYEELTQAAKDVTLGAFAMPESLINKCDKFTKLTVSPDALADLPSDIRDRTRIFDGGFYTAAVAGPAAPTPAATPSAGPEASTASPTPSAGPAGAEPKIGDLRVKFSQVLPGEVSVIAQQKGNSFEAFGTDEGTIELLSFGKVSAAEMYKAEQAKSNLITWVLRLVGFLVMGFGMSMVSRPLSVLGDIIPFVGSIIGGVTGFLAFAIALPLSLITISIAWVWYRPMVGIPILVVGLVLIVWTIRLKVKAVARRAAAIAESRVTQKV